MNTGQTMVTIFAFLLVSTVLVSFYGLVARTDDDIASGQDGILATTIATSYMELAQGTAFDEVTSASDTALANTALLTPAGTLGTDSTFETDIDSFNDFDDFKGYSVSKVAGGTGRTYKTTFDVNYVNPDNLDQIVNYRTFVKRMDLKTWRTIPPPSETGEVDTLKTSLVMGYFHFD